MTKKIALIGNMNNNFFSLVRYLRESGHDAYLGLLDDNTHFSPEADTYDDEYRQYTFRLDWSDYILYNKFDRIKEVLDQYDIIVGCDIVPFLCAKIGRKLDVFIPYGGDLYHTPFNNRNFFINDSIYFLDKLLGDNKIIPKILWKLNRKKVLLGYSRFILAKFQRKGIVETQKIFLFGSPKNFENILVELGVIDKIIRVPIPMVYSLEYKKNSYYKYIENSDIQKKFKQIREKNDIVIFHHSRQAWKDIPNKWTQKRNDKLFKGVAKVIKKNASIKICIICFDYGPDVENSKELIKELGIDKNVVWMPTMQRKDIMTGIDIADIGAVDFGISWVTGGVLFEFLSRGIPVMQYLNLNEQETVFPSLYPIIPANEVEDIEMSLLEYIDNKEKFMEMGEKSKDWYDKYVVEYSMTIFKETFKEVSNCGDKTYKL